MERGESLVRLRIVNTRVVMVGLMVAAVTVAAAWGVGSHWIESTATSPVSDGLPQQPSGDGWRLLLDEPIGEPFALEIATNQEELTELWRGLGLSDSIPAVAFDDEVVVHFGAVESTGCEGLTFIGVAVDTGHRLVHGELGSSRPRPPDDREVVCAANALPRAFVVVVDRSILPKSPFTLQLYGRTYPRPESITVAL